MKRENANFIYTYGPEGFSRSADGTITVKRVGLSREDVATFLVETPDATAEFWFKVSSSYLDNADPWTFLGLRNVSRPVAKSSAWDVNLYRGLRTALLDCMAHWFVGPSVLGTRPIGIDYEFEAKQAKLHAGIDLSENSR